MIVVNFDVLAFPGENIGARVPDPDGMKLWRMFHAYNRGSVAVVFSGDLLGQENLFEEWLRRENVKAAFYESITDQPVLQVEKVHRLSTMFGRADWYVDSNVPLCVDLMKKGVRCFVYANPQIIMPEWHELRQARPWDELVEEMDRQAALINDRSWGDVEDLGDLT